MRGRGFEDTIRKSIELDLNLLRTLASDREIFMLTNSDGAPWTSDGFRASWGKACKRVGVVGLTLL